MRPRRFEKPGQVVTLGIAKLSQCVSLVRVDWRREDDGESGFRREQKVG
jgi:hypothetical protein